MGGGLLKGEQCDRRRGRCRGNFDGWRRTGGGFGRDADGNELTTQRQFVGRGQILKSDQNRPLADFEAFDLNCPALQFQGIGFAGGKGFVVDDGQFLVVGAINGGQLYLTEPSGGGGLREGANACKGDV